MELTDSLKTLFRETATTLKGSARRLFMARTVKELGFGGQRRAERALTQASIRAFLSSSITKRLSRTEHTDVEDRWYETLIIWLIQRPERK